MLCRSGFRAGGRHAIEHPVQPSPHLGKRRRSARLRGPSFKATLIQAHLPTAIKLAIEENSVRHP
jgi:hypothetical protein